MPSNHQKGDAKKILVVAERRKALDRDMLSVALFGWVMDKVRTEKQAAASRPRGDQQQVSTRPDVARDAHLGEGEDA